MTPRAKTWARRTLLPVNLRVLFLATVTTVLMASTSDAQIDPSILPPVGYHPSEVTYFNTPYLSNSMLLGGEWREFNNSGFGTSVPYYNETTQFVNGYPQSLGAGGTPNQRGPHLRALLFGVNINNTEIRPPGWPVHDTLGKGRYTLTWTGEADIRLQVGTFVPGASTLGEIGASGVNGGTRVYDCAVIPETLEVRQIGAGGIQSIKVWLPAVDDPSTPAQENMQSSLVDQFFHPIFLERIADANWGYIRFMDWGKTNASPQMDWIDRRLPNHLFQFGIINDRAPNNQGFAFGDRETGVAWEHMVALSNATGKDLWINVPHLATEDYIRKLARLIRFGSDGVNPFTSPQVSPAFPPLNSNLKVYVEFSNEIWSSGGAFPQGNWAEEEAATLGITKPQFTARKFCDTWSFFQDEFDAEASRLVRVAAIFTANDTYSRAFMNEIGTYGASLDPAVRPDVLALTTYFGNDIQGFVNDQGFTAGKLFGDSYWQSDDFDTHQHLAFDEWKRRILSGDSASGSGPDATGTSGGFDAALRDLAKETLLTICPQDANAPPCLPLIAYEGGPSIFTNDPNIPGMDGTNATSDDNVTIFMEAMNRDPRIDDGYRMHLDLAKSKGLWTHTPYTDTSQWSRFGQWGHLELLEQDPEDSPKYSLMLEHHTLFSKLRHIDAPLNLVPSFVTSATLPTGIAAQSYGPTSIVTTGGDGSRSVVVVGAFLDAGLSISSPSADTLQISGTPITSRKNFILARVQDGDGDPAWRTFTLQTFGGPGTLVQSNFQGTNPAQNLPWTPTFVLSGVNWSGWNKGSGIVTHSGDDAIFFSIAAGGTGSTLTEAIAENEFLTATITPNAGPIDLQGAEVRFSIRRHDQHSPQSYSVFSSVGGFATSADAHFTGSVADEFDETETEFVFTIPTNTPAFSAINSAMEFRIYASNGKFDDKQTSLTGFKLTTKNALTVTALSPSAGPTTSGQKVILEGADLTGATSVTFGGTAGTITSNSATAINVTAPAGAPGTVNVVVTTPGGSLTLTGAYRFLSAPTIGTIVSNSGSTSGIESVTITGTNLGNATVTFGGLPAPVTSNTATSLVVVSPPHAAGAVNVVVTTAGGSVTSTNGYTYTVPSPPAAPAGLAAEGVSSSQVDLTWNAVAGATSYEVDRKSPGGSFTQFATPVTNSVSDTGRSADTAFLYRVRAVGTGGTSTDSASALATTVVFTDDPLVVSSTKIKRAHLIELRTAIQAVRSLASLSAASLTDPVIAAGSTPVRTLHVSELRTALSTALTTLGFSAPVFSSGLATSSPVKQSHFQELRTLVK